MQYMYPAQINSPSTRTVAPITDTDTVIQVADIVKLPHGPNLLTIGTGEDAETIYFDDVDGNTIVNASRGFQGTARAWPAGTPIARNFTAYDHDSFLGNLLELISKDESQDTRLGNLEAFVDSFESVVEVAVTMQVSITRSNKDSFGIFRKIETFRKDGSKMTSSELSGGVPGQYAQRTVIHYSADGTTPVHQTIFTRTFDADGELIAETIL